MGPFSPDDGFPSNSAVSSDSPAAGCTVDRPPTKAYLAKMTDDPNIHDLAQQIARLEGEIKAQEERMKTMTAENESGLDRLRADLAQRDKDNQRWVVGFGIAQMVLTVAILAAGFAFLGILIGFPG